MYKKLLALSLTAAVLCACSKDSDQQPLACGDTSVEQSVRSNIQEIIKQQAREFARKDSRQFVDADKLIALAAQLNVTTSNAQAGQMPETCQAQVAIAIPENLIKQAQIRHLF